MPFDRPIRVAALQFGAGSDVEANLATCLRMIDQAAEHKPDLMVLPEFCNHLSWYDDVAHCFRVSAPLDGDFLNAIAAKARQYACHIVVNVTLQRQDGKATGSSLLYGPGGDLLSQSDKQVLMGHENDFLERAQTAAPIVSTAIGRLATYACMDGVINETPRGLALRGAQILCNSLNSFALDEASLHVPVRASENRVFIVAANKVGPLIPDFLLEPVSQATNIPIAFLHGAGESQIVAPDGTVLAKGPRAGEAVVVAEIDPRLADDKHRPDGVDVFASRRPELYAAIGQPPAGASFPPGAPTLAAAVYQPQAEGADAVEEAADAVAHAAAAGVQLVVLPELFCFETGRVGDVAEAVARSTQALAALAASLRAAGGHCHVVTSVVEATDGGFQHTGVVLGPEGVIFRQPQLHRSARHSRWATALGVGMGVLTLPWGRLAVVVGDDALYPETFRLAVFQGADVVAAPVHICERWEVETGLVERAAENRVCLVAASRPGPAGAGLIATLHEDFTLMTPWPSRPFDGTISYPILTSAPDFGLTSTIVHPARTQNKVLSHRTHVVDSRPWHLAAAITDLTG